MKQFHWKYTQFSQFNESDTLLLVSGVHFGQPHSSAGEIMVFSVDEESFNLQCRVSNRPYDIFGTWFTDQFLISGDIHWLAHLVSGSVLWLNKASQETGSEHVQILKQLYKFYNQNGSSIRAVMVANCPWLNDPDQQPMAAAVENASEAAAKASALNSGGDYECVGNPVSNLNQGANFNMAAPSSVNATEAARQLLSPSKVRTENCPIKYTDNFRKEYTRLCEERLESGSGSGSGGGDASTSSSSGASSLWSGHRSQSDSDDVEGDDEEEDDFAELEHFVPKYLIFSLGCKTYTPHQIGFKQIRSVDFPKKMNLGLPLKERIARRRSAQEEPRFQQNWQDYDSVKDNFDTVDKLIDLHGHVIGMGLSPDQRYLYVNSRPWPANYVITNPMEPPPIAQEIDIYVIDLMTLEPVGNMLRAHKAYTPNTECFFIFLDVCDNYVAR